MNSLNIIDPETGEDITGADEDTISSSYCKDYDSNIPELPELNADYMDSPISSLADSVLLGDDSVSEIISSNGRGTPESLRSGRNKSTRKFFTELCDSNGVPVNDELRQGYRILKELVSFSHKAVNAPFIELPDKKEHAQFYTDTKNPISLTSMQDKFEKSKYKAITEFVKDFRCMLEDYLRYFGPDDMIAKKAQKFDIMMEQKLTLLSRELRDLTTIERTHGQSKTIAPAIVHGGTGRRTRQSVPNFTTILVNILRQEFKDKEKEMRKQQIAERQRERETHHQELMTWEEALFSGTEKDQMRSMWELPQIGLFIYLCQEPLNCGEIPQYEVERFLLLPKQSQSLQLVMTSLLSTPYQRT